MLTTPNGIPYLEDSDHPLQYPTATQALANLLNTAAVPIFASATERDATITAPVEGMRCWRSDLNVGEVYGSSWRIDAGVAGTGGRVGFGRWNGTLTTDAGGQSQVVDLSAGGIFSGNVLWASGIRIGSTSAVQLGITSALITAAKFGVRSETGALLTSQSVTISLAYLASLAY